MIERIYKWLWNKLFSLDKLLAGLSKLMARLEKLSAMRKAEVGLIEDKIKSLRIAQSSKEHEANRAERIKNRFEALVQ